MATYIKPEAIKDSSLPIAKIDNVALDLADKVNALDDSNKALFLNKINAMPATPSGDPMHYAYVAAGAEYNDTGSNIVKTGMYGDTIIHKTGYWYLNELGDITNDEMRQIYVESNPLRRRVYLQTALSGSKIRTNITLFNYIQDVSVHGSMSENNISFIGFAQSSSLETVSIRNGYKDTNPSLGEIHMPFYFMGGAFLNCRNLKKILGVISFRSVSSGNLYRAFEKTYSLEEIRLYGIKINITLSESPNLSSKSILYMIQNEASTSAITITLHPDAYARAMADAEIVAALETHTNISLASA